MADDAILVRQMAAASPNSWVLTHRPIWALRSNVNANVVMQAASNNDLGSARLVISGHTHTFQTYTFAPARVIGNSGDNLAAAPNVPLVGAVLGSKLSATCAMQSLAISCSQ